MLNMQIWSLLMVIVTEMLHLLSSCGLVYMLIYSVLSFLTTGSREMNPLIFHKMNYQDAPLTIRETMIFLSFSHFWSVRSYGKHSLQYKDNRRCYKATNERRQSRKCCIVNGGIFKNLLWINVTLKNIINIDNNFGPFLMTHLWT